ncbi:MFS transporter [Listeria grandensis]|uniref:MFS transporter n=1 Tax=Listeria grandensis TaxID=1494963 RepID=UPI0016270908|nr:MFS transporter [Listeria grandensis]MBC1474393.1 MFS transporter [Listeria grandensis]
MRLNKIFYLSGISITFYGNALFTFILSWWLIKETGNTDLLSKITAITFLPTIIINLFAGSLVDKFNKKMVLIISDIVSGLVCMGGYYFLRDDFSVPILASIVVSLKILGTFFSIGSRVIVPFLFKEVHIHSINGWQAIIKQITEISGPLLGGVLAILWGPQLFFLINGISFIISAVLEMFLQIDTQVDVAKKKKDAKISIVSYFQKERRIFLAIVGAGISNFFIAGLNVLLPFVALTILNSDMNLSIILAFQATGAVLAPIILKLVKTNEFLTTNFYFYLIGSGIILIFAWPNVYVLCAVMFIYGTIQTAFNINFFSYIQVTVEQRVLGRAVSFIYVIAGLLIPLGAMTLPYSSYVFGGYSIMIVGILFTLSMLAIFITSKRMERLTSNS